jgi:hypothetical protein
MRPVARASPAWETPAGLNVKNPGPHVRLCGGLAQNGATISGFLHEE